MSLAQVALELSLTGMVLSRPETEDILDMFSAIAHNSFNNTRVHATNI